MLSAFTVALSTRATVLPLSSTTSPLPATPNKAPPAAPAEICATALVDTAFTDTAPLAFTTAPSITSARVLRSMISVPMAPDTPTVPMARAVAELATMAWLAAITSTDCAALATSQPFTERTLSM